MKILVVDDNEADRYACRRSLRSGPWAVQEAPSPVEAFAALERESFDVVLSDFNLKSDRDGIAVLSHALRVCPQARRILMSGYATPDVVARARQEAAIDGFFAKPDLPSEWAAEVDRVLAEADGARGQGSGTSGAGTSGRSSSGP